MKEKIKQIYGILGIILLILIIAYIALEMFGLKLNKNFFTYKKTYKDEECIKVSSLYEKYQIEMREVEIVQPFCTHRPPLFIKK